MAKTVKEVEQKKRGWDEIESLFDDKKKVAKEKSPKKSESRNEKRYSPRPKKFLKEEKPRTKDDTWIDDGLGGKYNHEGDTGRVQDGVRVFKAHILSKPNAGTTKECPFDCNCCFI